MTKQSNSGNDQHQTGSHSQGADTQKAKDKQHQQESAGKHQEHGGSTTDKSVKGGSHADPSKHASTDKPAAPKK